MALTTKRIIALPSQNDPQEGDYLAIDNATSGTHKIPAGRIGVEVDDTLTEQGKAADAKATGDALDEIRSQIEVAGTASGAIATFTDGSAMPAKSVIVNIEPQQSGTGTPSPDNVRPISGWESVNVYVRGKNLFDEVYTNIYDGLRYKAIFVGNGTFTMSTTTPRHPDGANLFFLAGQVTTGVSTNSNGVWANQNRTVASVNGYVTIAYRILGSVSEYSPVNYETQIEVGTTATEYQPYNLNSHTTTTSLGRTVYGGTLDVVSGVLTVTHGYLNYNGSENWQADSSRYTIGVSGSYREGYTRIPVTSNAGVFGTGSSVGTIFLSNAQLYYYPPTSVTSLADFKTWLASNNLQVVYPLATPQTYTLTGQEISTLLGDNNVWADSGDVEVVYIRDLNIAINNLLNGSGTRSLGMMAMSAPTEATADEQSDEQSDEDMR